MASSVFFILLPILLLSVSSISPSHSTLLLLPLTHSLSTTQFTSTHHLLKSTSARSAARFLRHRRRQISLPLSPGTDYTLSFSVGTDNPQTISAYMDTGSDVVWFPCHPFECILCENKYDPKTIPYPFPLNLSTSSSSPKPASCKSRACSAVHSAVSSSDLCAAARCPLEEIEISDCAGFSCPPFYYAYADGSLIANLYTDRLSTPTSSPSLLVRNFTFGCAHNALAEPIGVAGFGRGVISLPAQLATSSPQLGNQFSYCLLTHEFQPDRVRRPSPLILGRHEDPDEQNKQSGETRPEFVYTPMLDNPKHPYFYTVGVEAVSVAGRRIPAPGSLRRVDGGGNGGMVVDSGTTFTILPSGMYDSVVSEFTRRVDKVHRRAGRIEANTGLSPCYYLDDDAASNNKVVPALVLHFLGNNNSGVALPRRNYFYEFLDGGDEGKKRKVGCVMLMDGGDDDGGGGPVGTLGNYQQQGFEVVYDLEKRRVGFAKRKCASLWDRLNQR